MYMGWVSRPSRPSDQYRCCPERDPQHSGGNENQELVSHFSFYQLAFLV